MDGPRESVSRQLIIHYLNLITGADPEKSKKYYDDYFLPDFTEHFTDIVLTDEDKNVLGNIQQSISSLINQFLDITGIKISAEVKNNFHRSYSGNFQFVHTGGCSLFFFFRLTLV
jgi:hypothetical protein